LWAYESEYEHLEPKSGQIFLGEGGADDDPDETEVTEDEDDNEDTDDKDTEGVGAVEIITGARVKGGALLGAVNIDSWT